MNIPHGSIADICRRYQVAELSIFGSQARGNAREDSDIDILVEFEPGVSWGWEYFTLEQELAEAFGRRVDMATKKWLKPGVRAHVLSDARVVYAA